MNANVIIIFRHYCKISEIALSRNKCAVHVAAFFKTLREHWSKKYPFWEVDIAYAPPGRDTPMSHRGYICRNEHDNAFTDSHDDAF